MTRILKKLLSSTRSLGFSRILKRINSRTFGNSRIIEYEKMSYEEPLEKSKIQLADIFDAAVRAVQPGSIVDKCVSAVGNEMRIREKTYTIDENVFLVGFGKAVVGMAAMMEKKLGSRLKRGIVSVPRGSRDNYYRDMAKNTNEYCFPNFKGPIDYRESSINNQPDEDTLITSHDIVDLAESLGEKDTLVVLISGGGSALFYMPRPLIDSAAKLRLCKKLQNSGASIKELNVVRKKLSMVKGGGLALMAYPARVVTLVLSDIVGDPMDLIASGPTIYSEKSPEQVSSILQKYNLYDDIDGDLGKLLKLRETRIDDETLLNDNKEFKHVDNFVIGNNDLAMRAASLEALRKGLSPVILRNDVVGDVRDVSETYAKLASLVCRAWSKDIEIKDFYDSMSSDKILSLDEQKINEIFHSLESSNDQGIVLIGGGEPEVVVTGNGRGGRNQELALRFSIDILSWIKSFSQLANYEIIFLSAGTDGQDGPTDAAGAFGYPSIEPMINVLLKKIRKISNERVLSATSSNDCEDFENLEISSKLRVAEKMIPRNVLTNNDSYNFYSRFRRGKDLLKTGITGTNVMDLHFLIVRRRECGCNMKFERKKYCKDPLEEHDLREDPEELEKEERARRMMMDETIDEGESKLLNLQIFDASLAELCCEKKSD